ncbi:hypothetical protein PsYK624_148420 [Phanerochaete sordida]|uniref:Uncharacterized protein n=1 Tax=Phanerochaete sordida TaxID=48140 RepID=A0A9P3LKI3_9APHY|nr:hypothetical protein PsYK624_148420 [Phanerochaete sordida]
MAQDIGLPASLLACRPIIGLLGFVHPSATPSDLGRLFERHICAYAVHWAMRQCVRRRHLNNRCLSSLANGYQDMVPFMKQLR